MQTAFLPRALAAAGRLPAALTLALPPLALAALAGLALTGCAAVDDRAPPPAPRVPPFVEPFAQSQPLPPLTSAAPAPPAPLPPVGGSEPSPVQQVQFTQAEPAPQQPLPLPGAAVPELIPAADAERPTLPIDFATALGLTQGQNPRLAFAQAEIAQAYAQYEAARVLWLPSLRAGMNYNKHEGRIQDVIGTNIDTSRGAAYAGLGALAVGAGSPAVPGLMMQFHLTDALHQPQIRAFQLQARQHLSAAALNDELLETALAYVALLEAMQRKAIAAETQRHGQALAEITETFARSGAGSQADADRAAAALALQKNEVARAEEAIAVASIRLNEQFSSDPSILLVPQEPAVVPIQLDHGGEGVAQLVALGLANRPELAASRSLVCEAVNRLRREQNAPWLPSVILGASYGGFGAGRGGEITRGGDRFDFDGVAFWEVRNLGLGERAARDQASAQLEQARLREIELMDRVAREVAQAQAQVEARRKQIAQAESAIRSAQQSHERNLARIRNAQGLPVEVLQSILALDQARREYLRAVTEHNQAQFELHRALGWPASPGGEDPPAAGSP